MSESPYFFIFSYEITELHIHITEHKNRKAVKYAEHQALFYQCNSSDGSTAVYACRIGSV